MTHDEQFLAQYFTPLSFPNAGSQEFKNNSYYILRFSDKTFGKKSSNLEIKSILKAILHPCQSDTSCDQQMCPRGKLGAIDRVDYLDLLSVLNSLTMAETFSTTLLSLFGSKGNILTLTVPNVLENNLIIKCTVLQSDNVCVCISTFWQGFADGFFSVRKEAQVQNDARINYQVSSQYISFPFKACYTYFPEIQHITAVSFFAVNFFQVSYGSRSSGRT